MGMEPCDVGPADLWNEPCVLWELPKRHHPNGIEPPELYEQWRQTLVESVEYQSAEPPRHFAHYAVVDLPQPADREIERAKERDLIDACPTVKDYIQACRYMGAKLEVKPEPFQAEGAVFARLIGRE